MPLELEIDPEIWDVLGEYALVVSTADWKPLGNAGGFSGARIYRGVSAEGHRLCLRNWPLGKMNEERLRHIHKAQDNCDVPIVPRLWRTRNGETIVRRDDELWEVSDWMPGQAGFHLNPNDERLFAAMRALAGVHQSWLPKKQREAPCPAVRRLITGFREWRQLVQSGWKPDFSLPYPYEINERGRRAWRVLLGGALTAEYALNDWTTRPVPIQLCLCDVWHDHILYTGNEVTGLIDFGAIKVDCVAVDLARLLGSLIPDEPERMTRALAIWSTLSPAPRAVLDLVPVLDRVGIVIGLTNWVRWLYLEQRLFPDMRQVARRMDTHLRRLEAKSKAALLPWEA